MSRRGQADAYQAHVVPCDRGGIVEQEGKALPGQPHALPCGRVYVVEQEGTGRIILGAFCPM